MSNYTVRAYGVSPVHYMTITDNHVRWSNGLFKNGTVNLKAASVDCGFQSLTLFDNGNQRACIEGIYLPGRFKKELMDRQSGVTAKAETRQQKQNTEHAAESGSGANQANSSQQQRQRKQEDLRVYPYHAGLISVDDDPAFNQSAWQQYKRNGHVLFEGQIYPFNRGDLWPENGRHVGWKALRNIEETMREPYADYIKQWKKNSIMPEFLAACLIVTDMDSDLVWYHIPNEKVSNAAPHKLYSLTRNYGVGLSYCAEMGVYFRTNWLRDEDDAPINRGRPGVPYQTVEELVDSVNEDFQRSLERHKSRTRKLKVRLAFIAAAAGAAALAFSGNDAESRETPRTEPVEYSVPDAAPGPELP